MPERLVTPLVKKLAAENGVDLTQVVGTGVGGRIRKDDVLAAAGVRADTSTGRAAAAPTPTRDLQVAPQNGAEMAAALGPRPGSDWFTGYAPAHLQAAAAEWDIRVMSVMSTDEYEAAEARAIMHLAGGRTFDQALAEVRARGDLGPSAATGRRG